MGAVGWAQPDTNTKIQKSELTEITHNAHNGLESEKRYGNLWLLQLSKPKFNYFDEPFAVTLN